MLARGPISVILALTSLAVAQHPPAHERQSVLLIVLDDVGTERLSMYGQTARAVPTPSLEQIAREGIVFRRAYANPSCSPTRALLQTGRYAFRTGVGRNIDATGSLALEEVTIAEMLKAGARGRAHACGMFGKWHLYSNANVRCVTSNGYDAFSGTARNVADHFHWEKIEADARGETRSRIGSASGPYDESTFTASVTRADAVAWINEQAGPYFACVCFHPPHEPYQVPPLSAVSSATAARIGALGYTSGQDLFQLGSGAAPHLAYEWMLEAVDREIGRLIAGIEPRQRRNLTILITGDNGPPAEVVGAPLDPAHAKHSVYELGTHVPLIAAGRAVRSAGEGAGEGEGCDALVSSVDLFATIADLAHADLRRVPLPGPADGLSFAPLLRDPRVRGARQLVFCQIFAPNVGYVPDPLARVSAPYFLHDRATSDGVVKYLRKLDATSGGYVEEAYLLALDPQERADLFPAFLAGSLSAEIAVRIERLRAEMDRVSGR